MDIPQEQLRAELDRAVRDFLALEGWRCSKVTVRVAVNELVTRSKRSTFSLAWLLDQISKLPVQAEPARRLHDLMQIVAAMEERDAMRLAHAEQR
jgi:hypothetical protein